MKKKIQEVLSKEVKFFEVILVCLVLVIIFTVKGMILAEGVPSDPTNLTLTSSVTPPVSISWTDTATDEDSYVVERKLTSDPETSFSVISSLPAGSQYYFDQSSTSFLPGSSYDYRVRACLTGTGCSGYTNVLTVLIGAAGGGGGNGGGGGGSGGTTPSAPSGFTASYASPSVMLSWAAPTTSVTHYNIQKKMSTANTYFPLTIINSPTVLNYSDTSVVAGTSYDYQIQACLSGYGCSSYSTTSILIPVVVPPAPLSLNASTTSTVVSLFWMMQSGTNVHMFNLQKRVSGANNTFSQIGSYGYSVTTAVDNNVTAGTTYDYQIQACAYPNIPANCSTFTQVLGVTMPGGAPVPPTNLMQSGTSTTQINLTWTGTSTNTTFYILEKKLTNQSTTYFLQIGQPTGMSYVDSAVTAGLYYDYRVKACITTTVCSDYSSILSGVGISGGGGGGGTTPIPPTGLMINGTVTLTSVPIKWNDNSTNEDSFKIYRRVATTGTYAIIGSVGTSITMYTDTSVSPGSYYDYQVSACSSSLCSTPVTLTGVSVPVSGGGQNVPNPPTYLSLSNPATSTSVSLQWNDNSTNEDSFKVERKITGSSSSFGYIGQVGTSITTYVDTTATGGMSYDYRVQACLINIGCSVYATLPSVLVPLPAGGGSGSGTIPNAPSNLTVLVTSTIPPVELHWTNNSTNQDKFNIERKLSSTTAWTFIQQLMSPSANTFTDSSTALVPGMSYDYRVQACLSGTGCSSYAVLNNFIIPTTAQNQNQNSTIPIAPTNFIINGTTTYSSIPLKWNDNSNNEESFKIYRKMSSAITYPSTPIVTTASNVTNFTDVTASQNIFWDYKIQACTSSLCSPSVYLLNVTSVGNIVLPPSTTTMPIATSSSGYNTFASNTGLSTKSTNYTVTPNTPISGTVTSPPSSVQQNVPITAPVIVNPQNPTNPEPNVVLPQTQMIVLPTSGVPLQIQNLGQAIENINSAINDTKVQLKKFINDSVGDLIVKKEAAGEKVNKEKIYEERDKLLTKVEDSLSVSLVIKTEDINRLKDEVSEGIENIKKIAAENGSVIVISPENSTVLNGGISTVLDNLSQTVKAENASVVNQGADLLFKDSNKDGISDYDSVNVYNLDPVKPSPVSNYDGKQINAAEKILLGFDPTKKDLVKVAAEDPIVSVAPTVPVYKVEKVNLTENKKDIVIKGRALPNSFVTVYVYSTPIMVTVKADSTGQWQYTLDKELENGDHTIYTATVNNSGNIIAKSPGYLFTKTAEAATLKELSAFQAPAEAAKPGFLSGSSIYVFIGILIGVLIAYLLFAGLSGKKTKENINTGEINPS